MFALAAVSLGLPAVVAAAAEGSGELTQLAGSSLCTAHPRAHLPCKAARALDTPRRIAVSPDGKNVYVAAAGAQGGLVVLARDPQTGALTQLAGAAGCLTEDGTRGTCTRARAVRGTASVAVSPDGKSVYVGSFNLAVFARNASTGALTQLKGRSGCVGSVQGCAQARAFFSGSVGALAVTPDGRNVYVASHRASVNADQEVSDDGGVAVFARAGSGALSQLPGKSGCVSNGGFGGCGSASPLGTINSLAVSPDGRNVYLGSETNSEDFPAPSAVLTFRRSPSGALQAAGCISRTKRQGCSVFEAIFDPTAIAVTPDGGAVYVTSLQTHSVAIFSRGAGGELSAKGCIGASFAGCTDNRGLLGPTSIALSADGSNVYVTWEAGVGGSAVSAFAHGPDGTLAFLGGTAGCIAEPRLAGCAVGTRALSGAVGIAVSPDSKNVYAAASRASAVVAFARG